VLVPSFLLHVELIVGAPALTPLPLSQTADFSKIQFAAILVFHDSLDAFRDLQLVCDLVRAQDGVFGTLKNPKDAEAWKPERQIPLHFSNPDLLWGNEFSQARFGQGALQESIAAVYKRTTGHELQRCVPPSFPSLLPLTSLPPSFPSLLFLSPRDLSFPSLARLSRSPRSLSGPS